MFLKSTLIGITRAVRRHDIRVGMGTGLEHARAELRRSVSSACISCALIINALAPTFGAQKDSVQALKAAAYSPDGGLGRGPRQT